MADCGREGGNFSRRRSAKRRERSVRRHRRGVLGGQEGRGVVVVGGGRNISVGASVETLTSAASWAGKSEVNALLAMMGDRTGSWRIAANAVGVEG